MFIFILFAGFFELREFEAAWSSRKLLIRSIHTVKDIRFVDNIILMFTTPIDFLLTKAFVVADGFTIISMNP